MWNVQQMTQRRILCRKRKDIFKRGGIRYNKRNKTETAREKNE